MDCKNRYDGYCIILDIDCDNPEENDPKNYNIETGFPCLCGLFEEKVDKKEVEIG